MRCYYTRKSRRAQEEEEEEEEEESSAQMLLRWGAGAVQVDIRLTPRVESAWFQLPSLIVVCFQSVGFKRQPAPLHHGRADIESAAAGEPQDRARGAQLAQVWPWPERTL